LLLQSHTAGEAHRRWPTDVVVLADPPPFSPATQQ